MIDLLVQDRSYEVKRLKQRQRLRKAIRLKDYGRHIVAIFQIKVSILPIRKIIMVF